MLHPKHSFGTPANFALLDLNLRTLGGTALLMVCARRKNAPKLEKAFRQSVQHLDPTSVCQATVSRTSLTRIQHGHFQLKLPQSLPEIGGRILLTRTRILKLIGVFQKPSALSKNLVHHTCVSCQMTFSLYERWKRGKVMARVKLWVP